MSATRYDALLEPLPAVASSWVTYCPSTKYTAPMFRAGLRSSSWTWSRLKIASPVVSSRGSG